MTIRWHFDRIEPDVLDVPFDRIEAAIDTIEQRVADGTLTEYEPEVYTAARLRQVFEAGEIRVAAA